MTVFHDPGLAIPPSPRSASASRGIAVLGSTGSIGVAALDVLERHSARFHVHALTANTNAELLREQVARFRPEYVGLADDAGAAASGWSTGMECLIQAATRPDVDTVINAVVGAAGLDATLAALAAGKRVALANKETLVLAGELVAAAAKRGGGEIVPIDSEHSAILQCITGRRREEIRRLILTASGGPFRNWSRERLSHATVADALRHPTWRMGKKITIDSATLANKALEVIEAHFLFGIPYDRIEIVVHPQSVVHSMVEFVDRSVLAQLGVPSMELPILYALTHPERVEDRGVAPFDPVEMSPLTFERVRLEDFPTLMLGIDSGLAGGAAPAVFNAANEQAVALFLDGRISFGDIPRAIGAALIAESDAPGDTRDALLEADGAARRLVREMF
ncbi:MAG: 1-deoxy-D-xylulose-5-phosphate reductoisomerase [Gemmatimonadaceae bacterium]